MNKKYFLTTVAAALVVGSVAFFANKNKLNFSCANNTNYSLEVNRSVSSNELSLGKASFNTSNGNAISFVFDSDKSEVASSSVIKLNSGATFGNETMISGISEIHVVASYGAFKISAGCTADNLNETTDLLDTNGQENKTFDVVLEKNANFFEINNVSSSTYLKSLSIKYTCTVAEVEEPILKTAVFADIQLCNETQVTEGGTVVAKENLGSVANAHLALRDHFNLCKQNNVDVIFMAGDITNNAIEYYYQHYQRIFESVYGKDSSKYPEIIWNMGNHEWWDIDEHETACSVSMFNKYANIDSPYLVKKSAVPYYLDSSVTVPTYYKVVNGVPFLVVSGENSTGKIGSQLEAEISSWLGEIANLDSVKAGGPIYVSYHYPLTTTFTFGEGAGSYSYVLENLLKDYPTAIVFTGDTHYPGVNERTINQVDFTSINIGSSSYSRTITKSATMTGDEHFYNLEKTTAGAAKDILTGLANFKFEYTPTIQMMDTMNTYSTKIDRYFSNENPANAKKVGITWNIPHNVSKSSFKYTNARFENTSSAQELYGADGVSWANEATIKYEVKDGLMTVRFPDTIQYLSTEHYRITVNANTSKTYAVVSDYYKCFDNPTNYYYTLSDLPSGEITSVTVQAYDFFDNPSLNTLTATEPTEGCSVWGVDYGMSMSYTDISTRINVFDTYDGGSSSYEAYYKGLASYNAGATVGYVIRKDKTNAGADNYVSLNNATNAIPTLQFKAKALSTDDIKVGITLVDGNGSWKTDFGTEYQKTLTADGQWHDFSWNLSSLFNITSKNNIKYLQIKMKSTRTDSINGYEMNALFAGIDLVNGNGDQPEPQDRGDVFNANTDFSKTISQKLLTGKITIDIKFISGNEINIMLGQGWDKYFGYYKVKANGTFSNSYEGVTISALDDGYYRLVFDLSKLNKTDGGVAPDSYIDLVYIRGIWSDVNGRIDIEPSGGGSVIRGKTFTAGSDFSTNLNPTVAISESISLDFKFTSGSDTKVSMMLGQGWNQYWGMFEIYGNGNLGNTYNGVSVTFLDDGYFRVTFNLSQLTKLADKPAPDSYVDLIYFRGIWTTGSGYVDIV